MSDAVPLPIGRRAPLPVGRPIRVLVVDDEPAICKALTLALCRAGCDAAAAQSGEEADALLRGERFDALVLDLRIPDLRGDVIYHLAASLQPQLRHQTLFITGDVSERAQALIHACGCPMLRKPFELADAVGAVVALVPQQQTA
jgi:DNA-binding response OmpR family regulator